MRTFLKTERQRHWAAALSVIAFLSLIPVAFDTTPAVPPHKPAPQSGITPGRHAVLGDSALRQQYGIKVISLNIGQTDQDSQNRHVTVTVSITNLSDQSMQVSPGLEMNLRTSDGSLYPMTAEYLPAGTVVGGPVAAKETRAMDVDFKLPASAVPAAFVFQPDAASPATEVGL
ncbi:MAG TPA: hypothetical protein VFH39_05150 [Candidatus Saccharimonadales bacterium]|nr:hypothetical protein [Candidatus Saccharimonadales bacterium]